MSVAHTVNLRQDTQDLDPDNDPVDAAVYDHAVREYIIANEGSSTASYEDSKGNTTIGVGFNMDAAGAEKEWNAAFASIPADQRPSFDDVYNGDQNLTASQVDMLFSHSLSSTQDAVEKAYGSYWDALDPNRQIAITDLYYNGSSLAGKRTAFYTDIQTYATSTDPVVQDQAMQDALWEVKNNSNPPDKVTGATSPGIQARRDSEVTNANSRAGQSNSI